MKIIFFITIFLQTILFSNELKIKAQSFFADEKAGISIFEGAVSLKKGYDELNASKVTVYTDKQKAPVKFIAEGDVSFKIETKDRAQYQGSAQKVIYIPKEKEYRFYKNVHLQQLDEKKDIKGDEVVLNILDNKASAKGAEKEPVIMIFEFQENKENK